MADQYSKAVGHKHVHGEELRAGLELEEGDFDGGLKGWGPHAWFFVFVFLDPHMCSYVSNVRSNFKINDITMAFSTSCIH